MTDRVRRLLELDADMREKAMSDPPAVPTIIRARWAILRELSDTEYTAYLDSI